MKKILTIVLLSLFVVGTIGLTGCGGKKVRKDAPPAQKPEEK